MTKEEYQSLTPEERQAFHANCRKKEREWNQVVFLVSAFALPGAGYLLYEHPIVGGILLCGTTFFYMAAWFSEYV